MTDLLESYPGTCYRSPLLQREGEKAKRAETSYDAIKQETDTIVSSLTKRQKPEKEEWK